MFIVTQEIVEYTSQFVFHQPSDHLRAEHNLFFVFHCTKFIVADVELLVNRCSNLTHIQSSISHLQIMDFINNFWNSRPTGNPFSVTYPHMVTPNALKMLVTLPSQRSRFISFIIIFFVLLGCFTIEIISARDCLFYPLFENYLTCTNQTNGKHRIISQYG